MKVKNKTGLRGDFTLEQRDEDGNIKQAWQDNAVWRFFSRLFHVDLRIPFLTGSLVDVYSGHNLIVNAGLAALMSVWNGDGAEAAFTYLAVGSDDTAVTAADTTLGTEIAASGLERVSATASRDTENVANDTGKLTHQWTASGVLAVKELGVFNAASAGTMFAHKIITTKNLESGDTLTGTYTVYSVNA